MTKPKMKLVQVNEKTQIEVRASIPDDVARTNFLEKLKNKPNTMGGFLKGYKAFGKNAKDIPRCDMVFEGDGKARRI